MNDRTDRQKRSSCGATDGPCCVYGGNLTDSVTIDLEGMPAGTILTVDDIPEFRSERVEVQIKRDSTVLRISDKNGPSQFTPNHSGKTRILFRELICHDSSYGISVLFLIWRENYYAVDWSSSQPQYLWKRYCDRIEPQQDISASLQESALFQGKYPEKHRNTK